MSQKEMFLAEHGLRRDDFALPKQLEIRGDKVLCDDTVVAVLVEEHPFVTDRFRCALERLNSFLGGS